VSEKDASTVKTTIGKISNKDDVSLTSDIKQRIVFLSFSTIIFLISPMVSKKIVFSFTLSVMIYFDIFP